MRPDAAQADRNGSVRAAARSWHKAGAISEETLKAIETVVTDDRARVGPVFRILLFLFTVIAAIAAVGFTWLVFSIPFKGNEELLFGLMSFGFGIVMVVLTEFQIASLKRSQGGTEEGTSFAALAFLIAGFSWFLFEVLSLSISGKVGISLLLGIAAVLLAAAAWRWGHPLYAALATASFLAVFLQIPAGRIFWILLPLVAAPFLLRLSDSERLPPALRHSCMAVLAVGLVGLYVAVHLGSFDSGALELFRRSFRDVGPASRSLFLRTLSIAATALVPVVYLAIGIRTRRYVFLLLGIGTGIASLVTLRAYVHVAPIWVVLTLSGAALVAVVFALRRYLDSGPNKERGGFTAEPLFQDLARQRLLEAGATMASFTPEGRTIQEEPKYGGGGGEFGGGGSSSEF